MAHRVVCISLVTAAGGEAIGHLVAERLGYRYVDEEVLELAAAHAGVDPALVENAEHHKGFLVRMLDALFAPPPEIEGYFSRRPRGYGGAQAPQSSAPPEALRRLIKDAIVEVAARGNVVMVAHAASMALAGRDDVLRVHVTASTPTRVRRLYQGNMLISEDEYAKAIEASDRQRRAYLARFYDVQDESPTHYDVVINTDTLDVDRAVAVVLAAAE